MSVLHASAHRVCGCLVGVLVLTLTSGLPAQVSPKPETIVELQLEPSELLTYAGHRATIILEAKIRDGFHINSNQPQQDYLIPTRVELADTAGFELEKVDYPPGELKSFEFAPEEKLSVYEGTLRLALQLRAKPGTPLGRHTLQVRFHYQACNDKICLRPTHRQTSLTVTVTAAPKSPALPR